MEKMHIKSASRILLVFFIGFVINYFYQGIITFPVEGDSLAYHIPIAKSIAQGNILHPNFYLGYYPSNAESFLSLLVLLHIPLNIFNILGWVLLFFALWKLGIVFGLKSDYALIYSIGISTIHGIIRWLHTQVIDIWLALFFTVSLFVLQSFQSTKKSYFILGCIIGLLIGTKYSGPLFALLLLCFYFQTLRKNISIVKIVVFLIPVILLGFSWYIRNSILMHNPIYPQPLLSLKGMPGWDIFNIQVWKATVSYPLKMLNAYISEYMLWPVLLLLLLPYISISFIHKRITTHNLGKLLLLGAGNFIVYLFLPTTSKYDIIVSSFRYSFPAFIPLILVLFLFLKEMKKEEVAILATVSNLVMLPSLAYRPKMVIPLFVIALLLYYNRYIYHLKQKK